MKDRLCGRLAGLLVAANVILLPAASRAGEAGPLVARIKAVGSEGIGNEQAGKAWRELARLGPDALPEILAGLDNADAIAANWLRAAVDAIAERAVAAGQPLPTRDLETFIRDTRHAGPPRRLAYEWLARVDPGAPGRLLPGMLQDPSGQLRRDAVAVVLQEAQGLLDRGDKPAATAAYRKALSGACDRDQVDLIAQRLKALGVPVDLAAHFGFIQKWVLLGPFDGAGGTGFDAVFPPEKEVDLTKVYRGKKGVELRWAYHATADPYGVIDLNKAIGKHHGAVAYAFAAVLSPDERPVQIRAGSANAVKIFLNGRLVCQREEYHHGMRMDQHIGAGLLQAGRNEILIKVCQNEQTEDWAQAWSFQLRICDAVGAAVPLTVLGQKTEKEGQR